MPEKLPDLPKTAYRTALGTCLQGKAEDVLAFPKIKEDYKHQVDLIFTSPPFPLNRKKRYGNLKGDAYLDWLAAFADTFRFLLKPKGSIVIELGNAWEPGSPSMSTLALKALLGLLEKGNFTLCQQLI